MAKRTKQPGGRKNVLRIRLTETERATLDGRAEAEGLETSTWAREFLLNATAEEEEEEEEEDEVSAWFLQHLSQNREMPTYLDYLTAAIDPETPLAVRILCREIVLSLPAS